MNQKRRKIVLDCDGVLADTSPRLRQFLSEQKSIADKTYNPSCYLFRDALGISEQDERALIDSFYLSSHFDCIQPCEGSRTMVSHLKSHYDLLVGTARPASLRDKTRAWLSHVFHPLSFSVYHTGEYYPEGADIESKEQLCISQGASLIVEDHLTYALACARVGIPAVLISKEYNSAKDVPLVHRVASCFEVPEAVKKILSSATLK